MNILDEIAGDAEKGAGRLIDKYGGRLTAAAVSLCGNETDAKDLVWETVDIAVRQIGAYRGEAAVFEWLYGIMQNLYRHSLRRKSATNEIPMADMPDESVEGPFDGTAKIVQEIDAGMLRDAVNALPPDMRESVVLRYFMDMPILQIAKFLSLPIGTVKSRLHYARIALARRLGAQLKKPAVAALAAALFLAASAAAVVTAALGSVADDAGGEGAVPDETVFRELGISDFLLPGVSVPAPSVSPVEATSLISAKQGENAMTNTNTTSIRMTASVMLAATMALAGESSAGYGHDEDLKTLYVTIESGSDTLPAACVPLLTGNTVTNLVKLGRGTLSVSDDLTSYRGDITVHEGTYSFATNAALGRLSNDAGTVYVEDGATLDYHPVKAASGWYTKRIVFGGGGVNGAGALSFSGPGTNSRMCFGSNLVMRANALIRNNTSNTYLYQAGGSYPVWLDMNGHTLAFSGGPIVLGCLKVMNPGHIIVSNQTFYLNNGGNNLGGGAENTFTYRNSSGYFKFGSESGSTPWTLKPESLRVITMDDGGISSSTNGNYWTGPVELNDNQRFEVQPKTGHFSLKGPVTGDGWLSVRGTSGGGHIHLFSSENSFTGGAVGYQATYHLWNDGALPADGGSLSLTNAGVRLENPNVTYTLPTLELYKSNSVSGGKGSWRNVVKSGDGAAVWDSLSGSGLLDVKSGTVRFAMSPRAQLAGLIEGKRTYYTGNTDIYNDWKALTVATNGVTLSPEAYYNFSHHLWTDPWPADQTSSSRRFTISYTGYLWNNETTNVTWSFAGCLYTHFGVVVDRTNVVFRWTGDGNGTAKGSVTVSPGPHHFDVRGYITQIGSNSNPRDSRLTWPTGNFAVGFDPLGRGSSNQADYQKLIDPGDGSLLTWDLPDQVIEGVTTVPGTAETVGSAAPVFRKMRFAAGTGADFRYAYRLESLEGFPAITGATDHFTVTSNWTIRASEIVSGCRLTTPGRLAFASGATISMEGSLPLQESYPRVFVIARSGIPDESLPEIAKGEKRGWAVQRSADGLDIELVQTAKGLKIIFR